MDQFKEDFYDMIEIFSHQESLSEDDIIFIFEVLRNGLRGIYMVWSKFKYKTQLVKKNIVE